MAVKDVAEIKKTRGGAPILNHFQIKSPWKANIIVIGTLILIVLGYFFWQLRYTEKTFRNHINDHARMLAGMIRLNADNAMLSQEIIEEIMVTFLGNSARFVDYLDTIEPFTGDELTAFAEESGLAGICIVRKNGRIAEGPPGWFLPGNTCHTGNFVIHHLKDNNIYYFSIPGNGDSACIHVGLAGKRIDELKDRVDLNHMLRILSGQAGIRYVRLDQKRLPDDNPESPSNVKIIETANGKVAEVRVPLGDNDLVVGLEAINFFKRVHQLRNEFFVFSIIIAGLGAIFTWILYRYQVAHLTQVRRFERRLAAEQEDAALGRASATITHEIRNPLNAISMGLQRLSIEADEMNDAHRDLVSNLQKAVQRTDNIINGLRRYCSPLVPRFQDVRVGAIIEHILALYRQACDNNAISINYHPEYEQTVAADFDLLGEVFENLIKNAIEAQPDGGDIEIRVYKKSPDLVISIANGGFNPALDEADEILKPYFTTKTRGSGLGLSISARIIRAHGGRMEIQVPDPGRVRINIFLPIESDDHENPRG